LLVILNEVKDLLLILKLLKPRSLGHKPGLGMTPFFFHHCAKRRLPHPVFCPFQKNRAPLGALFSFRNVSS